MIIAIAFLVFSAAAYLGGLVWLLVLAFGRGEKGWGIGMIVATLVGVGPIVVLVYIALHWAHVRSAGWLVIASFGLAMLGLASLALGARSMAQEIAREIASGTNLVITLNTESTSTSRSVEPPAPRRARAAEPGRDATPGARPARPVREDRPERVPVQLLATPATASSITSAVDVAEASRLADRPEVSPVRVTLVRMEDPMPNEMRMFRVRVENEGPGAVRELKVGISYWDDRGNRIGGWKTVHSDGPELVGGRATNEFELRAFSVPRFTRQARFVVEGVSFSDGTRWPKAD